MKYSFHPLAREEFLEAINYYEDEIFIIAVMQLNREPGYWNKRIK